MLRTRVGGFIQMIRPLCKALNINPDTHVYANELQFNQETGSYEGFNPEAPTSER